jgi:hypothetical protein
MTTYLSTAYAASSAATASTQPTQTGSGVNAVVRSEFTVTLATTQALISGDLIKLAPIPLNYKVESWFLDIPRFDTNTSATAQLGDNKNSSAVYASIAANGGQAGGAFVRTGDSSTVVGTVGSQLAVYNSKHSSRVNKDAADDFILRIAASPGLNNTGAVRTFYGWVDFAPANMNDNQ